MKFNHFEYEVRARVSFSGVELLLLQQLATSDRCEELSPCPWKVFGPAWITAWIANAGCDRDNYPDVMATSHRLLLHVSASLAELTRCSELLAQVTSHDGIDLRNVVNQAIQRIVDKQCLVRHFGI